MYDIGWCILWNRGDRVQPKPSKLSLFFHADVVLTPETLTQGTVAFGRRLGCPLHFLDSRVAVYYSTTRQIKGVAAFSASPCTLMTAGSSVSHEWGW